MITTHTGVVLSYYRLNNDAELLCKNSKLRPEDVFVEENQVVVDKEGIGVSFGYIRNSLYKNNRTQN